MKASLVVARCTIIPKPSADLTEVHIEVVRDGVQEEPFRLRLSYGRPYRLMVLKVTAEAAAVRFAEGTRFTADIGCIDARSQTPECDFRPTDRSADPKTFVFGSAAEAQVPKAAYFKTDVVSGVIMTGTGKYTV